PIYNDNSYWPARRPEDSDFSRTTGQKLTGAIWCPTGGYISDPQLSTHNVQVAAESNGAEFLFNSEVVDIRKESGHVTGVTLKDGTVLSAPVVVNAAGPHSFIVNRLAGIENSMKIKTRALRQEVIHIPAPSGFDFKKLGCVTSDNDIGCYSRPELGNHILCGSEDPPCDTQVVVDDPDNFNRNLTEQAKVQAMRLALRISKLGIPGDLKGVVDLYDVTEDWIPIYDKSDLSGFYLCIGTSGNQYKNAPVVGKLMAELIEACQEGHDHDLDPVKVNLYHISRTVNIGFYSRLREINKESSFTVLG
ncbi:MAG TPA: FAD-binding oxidoreductase, partial [Deltaproteobacteria bacterium]|nr:FAD-binding oxidoreductase [Deltaproteobacteria bacterium]